MDILQRTFTEIYRTRRWGGAESASGKGSDIEHTGQLIEQLNGFLRKTGIRTMLDAPCGDFNWMQHVDLDEVAYIGGDIVPELIESNRKKYGNDDRLFIPLDLVTAPVIPEVDLIFCRDCLVHLPVEAAKKALENMQGSGSRYLALTTFLAHDGNIDVPPGGWYPINMEKPPFSYPKPDYILLEGCRQDYPMYMDKAMGIWDLGE